MQSRFETFQVRHHIATLPNQTLGTSRGLEHPHLAVHNVMRSHLNNNTQPFMIREKFVR
jgi:hypothetical protein